MTPTKTSGQQTVEEFQKQQQMAMMAAANLQFINILSMTPPPSKLPVEVRAWMWRQLERTRALFAPQNDEERIVYEAAANS